MEELLIRVLFIFVTFLFPNIGYSAVPNMATNLRLDSLNSTNRDCTSRYSTVETHWSA